MKILLLDIETAPNVAYIWKLYDDYISPDHLVSDSYIMCVSAKWYKRKEVVFASVPKNGKEAMLRTIHKMMSEADVIVHYNGLKFDIPTLNKEFLLLGLGPTSPVKHIDLLKVVRQRFRFTSNKLDFVCKRLGLGAKVQHKGMQLWRDCMAGDPKAWKLMKEYNMQDVVLLEKLYTKLIPWVKNHPNHQMHTADFVCPSCGEGPLKSHGLFHAAAHSYERFVCQSCGAWSKGKLDKGVVASVHPIG